MPEQMGFAHARSVIRVRRTSIDTRTGEASSGERTFISSLTVEQIGDGRRAAAIIRAHWEVENKNHWKRDANWQEDKSRLRTPTLARLLALLRGALLGLVRGPAPDAFEKHARDKRTALAMLNKKSN
jgi:predicted transposase YbfD/YdcC